MLITDNTATGGGGMMVNSNSVNSMNSAEGNMDGTMTPNPVMATPGINNVAWNRQQAVSVRHAFKNYGSSKNPNQVLQNLNMTVAKGSIYGLLGASGCGKTTLLSCIVGRRRLNSGEIWVLGGKPGTKGSGVPGKRVGYMPQEIALYGEFTIRETMMYFGWIFGMCTAEIVERLRFLLNFLDLPSQNRLVKNLSGGQQRRVSFAVALMHDPELLILDEPTVGVDPLLRQSIWNHLVQITKDGNKTVIITTHYIEEARQAHMIGLMRSGRLLAEESPRALLTMYNCASLEDVFLKLSRKQGQSTQPTTELNISNNISLASLNWGKKDEPVYVTQESGVVGLNFHQSKEVLIHDTTNGVGSHYDLNGKPLPGAKGDTSVECDDCGDFTDCYKITSIGKIRALLQKNFLRMWRNVGVMLFIFALPVMQVILFCLAIGRDPTGLKIAIVNHEMTWGNLSCPIEKNCSFTNLSCRYLKFLDNETMVKEYYPDPTSAKDAVRAGEAWGALYFTENFTDALVARMVLGRDADDETLDQSEIRVWLDMSNQQIGLMLARNLQYTYRDFAKDLLSNCDQNTKLADVPIQFKDPIYGSNEPSFTDFVAPGVILTIVFFLAVALTSSALIIERMEGLLDRSWVAGVSPGEILFSHVVTQFVVMCGQTALVLIFMILVFGVECKGEIGWVIILTILQGLCGMCFGFVISAICELERNAIQLALGSFYPTLLLSGVIWPIEGMPTVLRYISQGLPLTMATTSLRSMLTRGWSVTEPDVYNGFISTIIWIVVFLTISMLVLKFKRG
ncbi:ABC transporter G family member 23 isoform X3 [Neodiprion virginianus]|uniref:ABC transporter G family member 23 isoform X3 n=1 Tax=Neodiprion fabricii TaxID=2872261 RepID=UPI001ED960D9|nr:ABC transporter G family member 23 isoform X3 [Neodiprion fabricii]XP_046433892.1 ABC transporter G family member 23 isoform X3 [Neodiprion fabricii]XP_046433900.1 ABC transporter G family member 23 isoform X3 [Neodiprion fabricii]XP_046609840.1 ABC transporter G family member 23 isoform X3 [Neodiprion virginianus]XP_046609850.1 ABC transporter G family member 23 isoform X3 [Neodiprion virginianus]XP_046609858.1 ABC transporter G family member 23 isoform X3 [Neodiprion virginianus]